MQCKDCKADCATRFLPGMLGCDGIIKWMQPNVQKNFYSRLSLLDVILEMRQAFGARAQEMYLEQQTKQRNLQIDTFELTMQSGWRQRPRFYKPHAPLVLNRRTFRLLVSSGAISF